MCAETEGDFAYGADVQTAVVVLPDGVEVVETQVIFKLVGGGFESEEDGLFVVGGGGKGGDAHLFELADGAFE